VIFAVSLVLGCHRDSKENHVLTHQETEQAISGLRAAYAAFNRGDIGAAVDLFDEHVEWIEPMEFPGGGAYSGIDGAKLYLTQSRAGATDVISEPERFIPSGDQIVVFVHARVRPKNSNTWQDVKLADVYRFHHGHVVQMRAFASRQDALHWVGIDKLPM
jgi:uncharacterized protein